MLKIKELRDKHHETQTQLAEVVGVSLRTIQNYEAGTVDVPSKNLKLIAKHYNVDISYFYSDSVKEPRSLYAEHTKHYTPEEIDIIANSLVNHEEEFLENNVFKSWLMLKLAQKENELIKEFAKEFKKIENN